MGFIVNTLPLINLVNDTDLPALSLSLILPLPILTGSLKVTLIVLLTATFTALFDGFVRVIVGAVKSIVELELVIFTVALVADISLKLTNAMLETINTAKINFILILPPPNPKTMPKIFNNLNILSYKF